MHSKLVPRTFKDLKKQFNRQVENITFTHSQSSPSYYEVVDPISAEPKPDSDKQSIMLYCMLYSPSEMRQCSTGRANHQNLNINRVKSLT